MTVKKNLIMAPFKLCTTCRRVEAQTTDPFLSAAPKERAIAALFAWGVLKSNTEVKVHKDCVLMMLWLPGES